MHLSEELTIRLEGHVLIREYDDKVGLAEDRKMECETSFDTEQLRDMYMRNGQGQVLLDQRNAIHNEHASIILARGLANRDDGSVYSMHFGSGGATIDPLGDIIFATPNTVGASDLNVPTYFEVVDDTLGAPSGNQMAVRHVNGTLFSDVEIRCVIDKDEPFGQQAFDNVGFNINDASLFIFDEIGLKSQDGLLLTHITFSPIQKSANRIIEVVYTLRVRICE
jgi:hypothetical protein